MANAIATKQVDLSFYATIAYVDAGLLDKADATHSHLPNDIVPGEWSTFTTGITITPTVSDTDVTIVKLNTSTGTALLHAKYNSSLTRYEINLSNGVLSLQGSFSGALAIAPAASTSSYTLTLPAAAPAGNGYALTAQTDGSASWTAVAAASHTHAATDIASGTFGVTRGGTGTATAFTSGSVVYAGSSGVYSQNNTNFFWDNANTRLLLGGVTAASGYALQSTGIYSSGAIYAGTNLTAVNNVSAGNAFVFSSSSLLMWPTAAVGDSGNAYTFADNSGTTYRQLKASSILLRATSAGSTLAQMRTDGSISCDSAGAGVYIKEGTNAKMGTATLVAGTVTVNTTKASSTSRIFLTVQSLGTVSTPKAVAVTARSAGTSFTITSSDNTDTSVVAWLIVDPA